MSWYEEPLKSKNLHPDTIKFMKVYEAWIHGETPEEVIIRVDRKIKALHYIWETEYECQAMWEDFNDWMNWLEDFYKGDYEKGE